MAPSIDGGNTRFNGSGNPKNAQSVTFSCPPFYQLCPNHLPRNEVGGYSTTMTESTTPVASAPSATITDTSTDRGDDNKTMSPVSANPEQDLIVISSEDPSESDTDDSWIEDAKLQVGQSGNHQYKMEMVEMINIGKRAKEEKMKRKAWKGEKGAPDI